MGGGRPFARLLGTGRNAIPVPLGGRRNRAAGSAPRDRRTPGRDRLARPAGSDPARCGDRLAGGFRVGLAAHAALAEGTQSAAGRIGTCLLYTSDAADE